MTILYLSDFDMRGSGYANIARELCTQLARRGYEVQALGLGYNGEEHSFPFRIAPLPDFRSAVPVIHELRRQGMEIEMLVVALDIPMQETILRQLSSPADIPYIGVFPLEAGPLCQSWALALLQMDARLIMSRFGVEECEAAGVKAEFIPIGVDCESWRPPTPEERVQLRQGLGLKPDTFTVLTVADNQERKFLSRSMEIFAGAFKGKGARYMLVTRTDSPVGWRLEDYALSLGIFGQVNIWNRGMSFKQLWSLFAASDCFLLTSKAEGLAMPVLEAMAMRLPVIGTGCTAIEEHLANRRGYLIDPDYMMIDPWGNSRRYFASKEAGVPLLELLASEGPSKIMLDDAQTYVLARTWDKAGEVLIEAIEKTKAVRAPRLVLPVVEVVNV